jgi:hypothetical protein
MRRHIVNVMRPTSNLDDRGQRQGNDETIIKEWPCKIETLSGNKAQIERMAIPTATHTVTGWGNPDKRLKDKDYLTGGNLGDRTLLIELINDKNLNGVNLILTCSETKLG